MKSSRVYITDYISEPDIEKKILGDDLADHLHEGIEVLLVWHERIDRGYIDNLPNLKGVVRYGVGIDNVDVQYAGTKNILVCNTPDYGTEEVSDTALAMILNCSRGITRYDYLAREFKNDTWQENTLKDIRRSSSLTLGVIGAGRIGGSVLLRANALRFKTVFYDPYVARGYEKILDSERVDELYELLIQSDIVSFHAPLTQETIGMVNEDFIRSMKEGASFVNTARGKVVKDIDAFYEPLKSWHLANVALDVLPDEPPKESKLINAWRNREQWLNGRLTINPHVAYYSDKAFREMRSKAAANAKRLIQGETPFNLVKA